MKKSALALSLLLSTAACTGLSFEQEPAPVFDRGDQEYSRQGSQRVHSHKSSYGTDDFYDAPSDSDFASTDVNSTPLTPYNRRDEVLDFGNQQQNSSNYGDYESTQAKPIVSDYIDAPSRNGGNEYSLQSNIPKPVYQPAPIAEPTFSGRANPIIEDPVLEKPAYLNAAQSEPELKIAAAPSAPKTGYLDLSGVNSYSSNTTTTIEPSKLNSISPRSKPAFEVAPAPQRIVRELPKEPVAQSIKIPEPPREIKVAAAPAPTRIAPISRNEANEIEKSPIIEKASPSSLQKMFLRPTDGEIIANFGNEADGTFNDGIKIRAAKGANVKAADSGEVVYSGNQLQGYGNMVIIRHPSGFLTSYAHLESLEISKGAKVGKGEKIGHVGDTGNVSEPQLHFGVREGREPVDPKKFL